jgi:zinc protease
MSKHVVYSAIIFIFLLNTSAYAQQDSSAKAIVNRYVEVIGGAKRWAAIHSTRFRCIAQMENGDSIEFVIVKNSPNKFYQKVTSKTDTWIYKYSGGVGVGIHNGQADTIKDLKVLDKLKLQSYILPDMNYESIGYKIKLEGTRKLDSIDYYEVMLESPNGAISWNYYDKESGLLRMVYQDDKSKTIFPTYKEYEGCLFPDRMFFVYSNGSVMEVETRETIINQENEDSLFK